MSTLLKQTQAAERLLADNQVSVYYDHFEADRLWCLVGLWAKASGQYRDYMHLFQPYRNGVTDYIIFGDLERPHFKASELETMSKYDLDMLHCDLICHFPPVPSFCRSQGEMTKAALIEDLMRVTSLGFYGRRHDSHAWHDLDYTYTLPGADLLCKPWPDKTGRYVKGTEIKVLVLDNMPEDLPAPSEDLLHRLTYGVPIRGTIRLKGECYDIEDLLDNQYKYDKAQVLVKAAEAFSGREDGKELIAFLKAKLPTKPAQR